MWVKEVETMLKISEKVSAKISAVLAVVFLIAVAVAAVSMPWLAFEMMHMPGEQPHIAIVFAIVYGILVLAAVAELFQKQLKMDDNFSIPLCVGAVLFFTSIII